MNTLSRHLIRIGILLTIVGVVLALLFGLSAGILSWSDEYSEVRHFMGYIAYLTLFGSPITLIGGIATVVVGLTLKAVAWGLRHR